MEANIAERRNQLAKKVQRFREEQMVFMPNVANFEHLVTPSDSSVPVEKIKLVMPSDIRDEWSTLR